MYDAPTTVYLLYNGDGDVVAVFESAFHASRSQALLTDAAVGGSGGPYLVVAMEVLSAPLRTTA